MLGWQEMLLRLALAVLLGGIIGFERERNASTAGLRTHMLVSLGAALAIIVSAFGFNDVLGHAHVDLDPSRIAAQVVSGVGFLGAGAILIMHRFEVVRGLTTAAGLWTVAAIGLAVGSGLYVAAIGATIIAWLILFVLKLVERRVFARRQPRHVRIESRRGGLRLADLESIAGRSGLAVKRALVDRTEGTDTTEIWFDVGAAGGALMSFADTARELEGVTAVEVEPAR